MSNAANAAVWFDAIREIGIEFSLPRLRLRCGLSGTGWYGSKLGRLEPCGEGNGGENEDSGLQAGRPSEVSEAFLGLFPNKGAILDTGGWVVEKKRTNNMRNA